MRRLLQIGLAAFALAGAVRSADAAHTFSDLDDYPVYGVQFLGGIGTLSDFPRLDTPYHAGVFVSASPWQFPLGFELGALYWRDDESLAPDGDVSISAAELYAGLHFRGVVEDAVYLPYFSFGVVVPLVRFDVDEPTGSPFPSFDTDDETVGLYARVGAHYLITRNISVGMDLRAIFATDLDMRNPAGARFTVDNVNGFHASIFLGLNF